MASVARGVGELFSRSICWLIHRADGESLESGGALVIGVKLGGLGDDERD